MSAEYRLQTIADFLAVPEDKLQDCFRDFSEWLSLARQAERINEINRTIFGEGVSFSMESFSWVDDGQAGISAIDFVTDGDTLGRVDLDRKEEQS